MPAHARTHTHVDLSDSSVEKDAQERRREQQTERVNDGEGCAVVGDLQNQERDRESARADRQRWDHILTSRSLIFILMMNEFKIRNLFLQEMFRS